MQQKLFRQSRRHVQALRAPARIHRQTATPGRRFVLVFSFAALAAAAPTSMLGQSEKWPIKEFEVINVAPLNFEDYDRSRLEALLIKAARLLPGDIEAAGLRTVPAGDDLAAEMRRMETMLSRTATQFEQWRFPPPQLEPIVTRNGLPVFRTYLLASIPGSPTAAGAYDWPTCFPRPSAETIISLSAAGILETVQRKNADGTTRTAVSTSEWGMSTLSHELFHAVQYATPFYQNSACGTDVGAWITEGTARAVGLDVVRPLLGIKYESVEDSQLWGMRNYSDPLPIPAVKTDSPPYNTASLWRYLAELYAAGRPGPEPGPVDYGYLADFLNTQPSGRDCVVAGDPCDTEIARLDGWLKSTYGGKGLREHLPKFLAAYVHYGEARGRGGTPDDRTKTWRDASFEEGCKPVELSPEGVNSDGVAFGKLSHEGKVSVKDTAARCWSVEPVNFVSNSIGVEVEVRLPKEEVLSQLVAVRASRETAKVSLQEAIVEVNQITGEPRARFMFPFGTGDKTPFLIVNVARDAQTTLAIEDMPIQFTALDNYARISSINSSPGPSGADIDQPLGITFDNVSPGLLVRGATTRYKYDPSLAEPCVLRVQGLHNAQGDGLSFLMDHEGPIGPGEYPVADGRRVRSPDPNPPGQVVAGFGLGFLNQPPAQQIQGFKGISGTLTVESVSGRLVTGVLDLVGENNSAEAIAKGWEDPPPNYLPGAVIRVEFGLLMHDPGDPGRDRESYDCLSTE